MPSPVEATGQRRSAERRRSPFAPKRAKKPAASAPETGGRTKTRRRKSTWPPEIAFLARHGLQPAILNRAVALSKRNGTNARDELFALPRFLKLTYWRLLARELGMYFVTDIRSLRPDKAIPAPKLDAVARPTMAQVRMKERKLMLAAPEPDQLPSLVKLLRNDPRARQRLAIAPPEIIRQALLAGREGARVKSAINQLSEASPDHSARNVPRRRTIFGVTLYMLMAIVALVLAPRPTWIAIDLLLALYFLHGIGWKLAAALHRRRPPKSRRVAEAALPTYSVLVPLYREANIVPDLVRALMRLNYPRSKLQILLIVEADDPETRAAINQHAVGSTLEVVIVPKASPRTKPKALAYALPFARGEIVCVYDAEDWPQPDQLRRAVAAFATDPKLACVQAALTPDNRESWLARMFTIEYAANFDVLLPALADWKTVLPLGGTSNHFRRDALEKVGAWDPFNVTEDADLGIRLARYGYRSGMIRSRTYEEAPVRLSEWLPQRRRWLKGWLQTSLVALATSGKGPRLRWVDRFVIHGLIAGGVVALLCYPALFLAAAAWLAAPDWLLPDAGIAGTLLIGLNAFNILAFLAVSVIASVRGLRRIRSPDLVWWLPTLPAYWALMSLAAWQALWLLIRDPFTWEKTNHGVSRARTMVPRASETGSSATAARERLSRIVTADRQSGGANSGVERQS